MTLEESIVHYQELSKTFKEIADKNTVETKPKEWVMSENFKQIAEWLKELKRYRESDEVTK